MQRILRVASVVFCMALVPVCLIRGASGLRTARGSPALSDNIDPAFQYLLNALLVVEGQPPYHTDHPGTTVQVVDSLFLRLHHWGLQGEAIARKVLSDPVSEINYLVDCNAVLASLAVILAAWLLYARTRSPLRTSLFVLSVCFLFDSCKAAMWLWPEVMLVGLSALLAVFVYLALADTGDRAGQRWMLCAAAVAGAGMATKITIFPLVLLLLLRPVSVRSVLARYGVFLSALAICLIPIYSQLPRTMRWFYVLSTHKGLYGSGAPGFIDEARIEPAVSTLLEYYSAFTVSALLLLAAGLASLRATRQPSEKGRRFDFAWVLAIEVFGLLFVAKHPNKHYFLPTALLSGVNLMLALDCLGRLGGRVWHRLGAALCLLCVAYGAYVFNGQYRTFSRYSADVRDQLEAFDQMVDRRAPAAAVRVYFYRSSGVPFGLQFANGYSRHFFAKDLSTLYPGALFFNIFNGLFETYSAYVEPARVFAQHEELLFIGSEPLPSLEQRGAIHVPAGWSARELAHSGPQYAYLLKKDASAAGH